MKRSNETFRRWSISLNRSALRVATSSVGSFSACGGLDHLQAVLVGAGQEEHVLAVEPLEARQRIGRDRLIGVADMRHAVRIGDRGRDVEDVFARRAPARALLPRRALRRDGRAGSGLRLSAAGFLAGAPVCWRADSWRSWRRLLRGSLLRRFRLRGLLFADFLTGFLTAFFAAGFLAVFFDFLVVFFAAFLAVFLAVAVLLLRALVRRGLGGAHTFFILASSLKVFS